LGSNQISITRFSNISLWQYGRRKYNIGLPTATELVGESLPHNSFLGKFVGIREEHPLLSPNVACSYTCEPVIRQTISYTQYIHQRKTGDDSGQAVGEEFGHAQMGIRSKHR